MTQLEQEIDTNLKGIKDLIIGIADTDEEGEARWIYYRSVIEEGMKSYAEDVCIGMLKWMDSTDMLDTIIAPEVIYTMFEESEGKEE